MASEYIFLKFYLLDKISLRKEQLLSRSAHFLLTLLNKTPSSIGLATLWTKNQKVHSQNKSTRWKLIMTSLKLKYTGNRIIEQYFWRLRFL